ncbi:MAG: Ppx/GppA phosphatase family protein, partial [Egibacteraceae bacterium]
MRIAALDLGSNSFHLLIADATPAGTLTPVLREKEMLRLGDVVARQGRITDVAADAALETLRRFKALAQVTDCVELVACATSAIRESANRDAFVARVAAETGIAVDVISGDTEARLIFSAVRRSVVLEPAPALCLDLGGGSLEVTIGDVDGARWWSSLPLGVARLTAELVGSDPPSRGDLRRLRERLEQAFAPVVAAAAVDPPRMVLG